MPRPGPRRRRVPLRLSEDEEAPVHALAAELPPLPRGDPNLSEAMRQLIALGHRARTGRTVEVSEAGAQALDELAQKAQLSREEIARLALSFAVQRAHHWLPTRKDT